MDVNSVAIPVELRCALTISKKTLKLARPSLAWRGLGLPKPAWSRWAGRARATHAKKEQGTLLAEHPRCNSPCPLELACFLDVPCLHQSVGVLCNPPVDDCGRTLNHRLGDSSHVLRALYADVVDGSGWAQSCAIRPRLPWLTWTEM